MKNIIYALVDPITEEVRYIGKSTSGLTRPRDHYKPSHLKKDFTYKGNWLRSLSIPPLIEVLHVAETKEELDRLEKEYIALYKGLRARLTNLTDGGEGACGRVLSESTKALIGQRQKEARSRRETPLDPYNKNHHEFIDGIESKKCTKCDKVKSLEEFGKYRRTWDGYNWLCKECHKNRQASYREKNPPKKLTKEEWKASYVGRNKKRP